jgi:hypothetical protein
LKAITVMMTAMTPSLNDSRRAVSDDFAGYVVVGLTIAERVTSHLTHLFRASGDDVAVVASVTPRALATCQSYEGRFNITLRPHRRGVVVIVGESAGA